LEKPADAKRAGITDFDCSIGRVLDREDIGARDMALVLALLVETSGY
jgi:hypothetical protein